MLYETVMCLCAGREGGHGEGGGGGLGRGVEEGGGLRDYV